MAQILESNSENLKRGAELLRAGEIVAFPTETVYGLGASCFDDNAIQKVFDLKGRPSDNPLIVHIADLYDLKQVVSYIPHWVLDVMDTFWPGPLTFVLPKNEKVSNIATAGLNTVAVRMPSDETARELIRLAGFPLVAPSANISGRPSPTTAHHVAFDFQNSDLCILDGGECAVGIESTVLLCEENQGVVLRPGIVSVEQIQKIASVSIVSKNSEIEEKPKSPGMKYTHYQPTARVSLVSQFPEILKNNIWYCELSEDDLVKNENPIKKINEHNLYALFRDADKNNIQEIIILKNESLEKRAGLTDRIQKASSG